MGLHAAEAVLILRFVFPRASLERRRALVGWWAGKLLRIVGITIQVEGDAPQAGAGGAMVAANHVSWLDIFALQSVRPIRFVAKSEVRDWPLAGWIAEHAGTLFIRRGLRREAARTNEHIHAALAAGDCVGIFPEGTTTDGDTLLKFHASLFEPAVASAERAPVRDPLPACRREPLPRGRLRGRLVVHAIARARDPPARRRRARELRAGRGELRIIAPRGIGRGPRPRG